MRPGRSTHAAWLAATLAILWAIGGVLPAAAQTASFRHLSVEDGLSEEKINALLQDQRGFIWIGTLDGLNRFDGYEVAEFRRAAEDSTTISANGVLSLAEDADGYLWVGTSDGGLNRFDPATERFTHFRHDPSDPASLPNDDINALALEEDGTIWVGTDAGLGRLDQETGSFSVFTHASGNAASLPADRVLSLFFDDEGTLWIGTDGGGLGRFERESETFTAFQLPDDPPGNIISAITRRPQGGLWVGTFGGGVRSFDPVSGGFQPTPLDGGVGATVITSLHVDEDDGLWIGTAGGGLHTLSRTGERMSLQPVEGRSDALSHNFVRTVMSDRQGILWVGTYGGLNWFDRARSPFRTFTYESANPQSLSSNTILSVIQTADSSLWVGTDAGLNRMVDDIGTFERYAPSDALDGGRQFITAMHESKAGEFWVGTRGGLLAFARASRTFAQIESSSLVISSIKEDAAGRIWVGSLDNGILAYDPATRTPTAYTHDPNRATSLSHQTVEAIATTADGAVWIGTANGLDRLVVESAGGRFEHFRHDPDDPSSISDGSVLALHARPNGELWIGTQEGGLNRLAPGGESEGFVAFTESNSDLPSNAVRAIVEDQSGFLWLSTSRGLARFDPVTETFRTFDGDRSPSLRSLSDASFSTPDGALYFGGADGLIAFDPARIASTNPNPPTMALTGVRILEEAVIPGPDAALRVAAPVAREVFLKYDHTVVTFVFAALHFSDPDQNRYAVRLEGLEDEWRDLGLDRRAVFTGLDPGRYTLWVKSANADGLWSEEPLAISVHVAPPWWRSIWAYALYALLLVGLVVYADRSQRRRLLRQEGVRAEKREAELRLAKAEAESKVLKIEKERVDAELAQAHELEKAYAALEESHQHLQATQTQLIQSEKLASLGQLTAGIAHEIKNPLNFVNNFAELSVDLADELTEELTADSSRTIDEALPELSALIDDIKENARRIHHHGQRADKIVHAMLQHSRGGAAERSSVDINAFVEEYANLAYHGQRARNMDFSVVLETDYDAEAGEVELIPQEIGRVLINLLGNAFYAVQEAAAQRGEDYRAVVSTTTRRISGFVEIRIADNGLGIPEDIRSKIFEPFFTTKPSGEGTGLGLSLSYEIVTQGHNGTMRVECPDEGTTFVIELPV